jgi:hypothetical protein
MLYWLFENLLQQDAVTLSGQDNDYLYNEFVTTRQLFKTYIKVWFRTDGAIRNNSYKCIIFSKRMIRYSYIDIAK